MDWTELLTKILEAILIPLVGVLTGFLVSLIQKGVKYLKDKSKNDLLDKYIDIAGDLIYHCVMTTNQTYVDALKEEGKFDAEAQKVAFKKTYTAVVNLLSTEGKEVLEEAFGDLDLYLTQQIEAQIKAVK